MNRSIDRLQDIVLDARARFALTTSTALARLERQQGIAQLSELEWIATDRCEASSASAWRPYTPKTDDLALLQYTSGSTSVPKGVALSHSNFIHNLRSLAALGVRDDDHIVSWLPPYHDMGLVGATLLPLAVGTMVTMLAPTTFLQRPFRWLSAISQYRGTLSGGPNFAFELCCRRISEGQRASLDLSSWRLAFSGAERVRAATLDRFAAAFASAGLKRSALSPCYGLAEATLGVSFTSFDAPPVVARLNDEALIKGRAEISNAENARTLVSCGRPVRDCEVQIVDPQTCEALRDGVVGEIWVRSPSVATGYWGKPELSEQVFRARLAQSDAAYLRTGDLGFIRDGELFVTGRLKELIVLRGVNYYPEDIEVAFEMAHPRLRLGCAVAFSVEQEGEERLVVVQEVDSTRDLPAGEISTAIRNAVAEQLQLQVHEVVLIEPGTLPKTSSGKLQRNLARARYEQGELAIVERSGPPAISSERSTEYVEPVSKLMADILGMEKVGPDEDFFWLGGHSLLATQLLSRVRETFRVDLPLRAIFEAPTPRQLSVAIANAPILLQKGPIQKADRNGPLALSFSQERMWLLYQLDPQGAAYNVAGAALIDGALNVEVLAAALNHVVRQHEVLRTRYLNVDGKPVVRIDESAHLNLERVDLTGEVDPLGAAQKLGSQLASRPFDIANDLLVRATLYRLSSARHVLSVSMHHLVTDAWSMGLFVSDLLRFYDELSSGKDPVYVEPQLTFVDYAQWQRDYLTDERLADQLQYWTSQLSGAEAIELPTDRPRSARRSSAGALEPLPLSPELLESLRSFATAEGTTVFMVMLAAFEVLLSRYTQRTDLVLGVPVANRNWLASEAVMGSLVNTLALRTQFDADDSFRALLRNVREVALDAYSHQDLPFEKLISVLPVERRPGESPLIRVMFDFQNAPMPGRTLGPVTMRPMMISRHASQFDLSLFILDTDFGRVASVEYSSELFEATTIRELLAHYVNVLEYVVMHPQTAISRIPLMTATQRERLLRATRPANARANAEDVLAAIRKQIERVPDDTAVVDAEGGLTYTELDAASDRLASKLSALGAAPGTRVAICVDRNRHLVTAVLAVLKTGAAYVPLDPRHPPDRVNLVLEDADIGIVLSQPSIAERLKVPGGARVLDIASLDARATRFDARNVDGRQAAYVIYTSGSTGRPKGVEVSRGALANFLHSMKHTPGMSAGERLLSVTTIAFDIAGLELLLPLVTGASVYVAPEKAVVDGRRLMNLMSEFKPTLMQATPATWKMLLDADWSGDPDLKILCGGEALPRELANRLLTRCASLWNMYGPTETTIWSTVHRVTAEEGAAVSIGRPIDATQIYILDQHHELVPRGVSGEIYIAGAGVANGYFKNPKLTAERFLEDSFAGAGARMYRTGDAGRWSADLNIEYLGRLDHQIKLRGFRIEPAEIEVAIRADERVRDVLVIAREFGPGDTRLVAYYVANPEHLQDGRLATDLNECLSRRLPSYMIPSAYVGLTEFPQTPNGKIDRKALPAPALDHTLGSEEYVAPRDDVELALQRLWQEILGVERVGVRDNFFMLGGHSLLATRLFAAIERTFDIQLQLSLLFERSTIEYLAERLRAEQSLAAPVLATPDKFTHLVPIQEKGARPRLFCVHGAGGHVLNFWAISQHLGLDQPFYALQAPGVDGRQSPYENIEAMASAYLTELRALQPHGPYYLSGYCGGGWIAFEMAKRLRADGEEVKLLALLDSYGPNLRWKTPRMEKWLEGTLREGLRFIIRRAKARLRRDYDSISHALRIRYYRWTGRPVPYELRDIWLTQSFLDAAATYRPAPYDGKVTLLLARDVEPPEGAQRCQYGWQGLVPGGLDVYEVPGTHHTLTHNPNAAELASTLLRCMALTNS